MLYLTCLYENDSHLEGGIFMPLSEVKHKQSYLIKRLPRVKLLQSLGIREGAAVSVVTQQPLGGPLVVEIKGRCVAVDRSLAAEIIVEQN